MEQYNKFRHSTSQIDDAIDDVSELKPNVRFVARGTVESSSIDTLNNAASKGLYVLSGQTTNMSHLLVTSAANEWIYQYLFGPFNVSASGVPATEGGGSQNTIGVRFYNKTAWSEWKYVDLSYLSGIKEVISGILTATEKLSEEKVVLTKAEFDELVRGNLVDDTKYYFIKEDE